MGFEGLKADLFKKDMPELQLKPETGETPREPGEFTEKDDRDLRALRREQIDNPDFDKDAYKVELLKALAAREEEAKTTRFGKKPEISDKETGILRILRMMDLPDNNPSVFSGLLRDLAKNLAEKEEAAKNDWTRSDEDVWNILNRWQTDGGPRWTKELAEIWLNLTKRREAGKGKAEKRTRFVSGW